MGLYYYVARWYDPQIAHFVQADTIVPSPLSSKSFDRFAYTMNNPIRFTDPTGHIIREDAGMAGDSSAITKMIVQKHEELVLAARAGSITDLEGAAQLAHYIALFNPFNAYHFIKNISMVETGDTNPPAWLNEVSVKLKAGKYDANYNPKILLGQSGYAAIFQDPKKGGNHPASCIPLLLSTVCVTGAKKVTVSISHRITKERVMAMNDLAQGIHPRLIMVRAV